MKYRALMLKNAGNLNIVEASSNSNKRVGSTKYNIIN